MKALLFSCLFFIIISCSPSSSDIEAEKLIHEKNGKLIFDTPSQDIKIAMYDTCEKAGGKVNIFSNGCANHCSALETNKQPICTQGLTKSCLCPQNQCYDRDINRCREIRQSYRR